MSADPLAAPASTPDARRQPRFKAKPGAVAGMAKTIKPVGKIARKAARAQAALVLKGRLRELNAGR